MSYLRVIPLAGSSRCLSRSRVAFTIMEILVALFIMAALAAIIVPAVRGRAQSAEAAAIVDNIKNIRQAILAYRENVGRYPGFLTQLQARPSLTTGITDICGNFLAQTAIDNWRGPYLAQRFTSTGLQVGGALISNTLVQSTPPTTVLPERFLIIAVEGVEQVVANEVDGAFDPLSFGTVDLTSGAITWESNLLRFWLAIRGC